MLVGAGGAAVAAKGEASENGVGTGERHMGEEGGGSEAEKGEARRNPYLGGVDPNGEEVIQYTAANALLKTGVNHHLAIRGTDEILCQHTRVIPTAQFVKLR